ncbi:MAG: tetratricopeptide repeat protein [Pseudomonadales bacterium]
MNHLQRITLGFFLGLCFTSISQAECLIPADAGLTEAVETYQLCLDQGQPVATDIDAAIGIRDFYRADHKAALEHFNQLMTQTDKLAPKLYLQRGMVYLVSGNERRALADFETVNTQMPGYAAAHYYRGETLLKRRRYGAAVEAYNTAIDLAANDTQQAPMYLARARAQLATKNRELALASLDTSVDKDKSFAPAYFERAILHTKLGNQQAALADYSSYLTLRPDSPDAYYNRGLVYKDLRQDHLAIQDFNRAIELQPDSLKMRASKSFTYLWPLLPVLIVLMLG